MTREGNVRDVLFFPAENNFGLLRKMDKYVKERNKKQTQNFD